jgi:hypothetical protein
MRENVEFKKKISKNVGGKAVVRLRWRKGKSVMALRQSGKERCDGERKASRPQEIRPKEQQEYRE